VKALGTDAAFTEVKAKTLTVTDGGPRPVFMMHEGKGLQNWNSLINISAGTQIL